ncbi:hypothetical protein CQ052_14795 [Ochrobactrum sp. MYb15]|uniref:DUF2778 domain-containing protein n=1 Tax=Brucella pituitosa TaxID=571256 RepID=UPI000CFD1CF2|nr:hypothetical protein CQZ90_07920 [Ochrobactrum sp. MYb19]PRA68558.1 hypothetical protein CQ053_02910 [Ochrobactrum sp. MYb18]PRA74214.1 hypothetical protein CQ049_13170 [Brucella thiophenivorans]PRA90810.1 hypothetical protein CQ051_12815 [Ochrobactrum sp. MYb14]PRA96261.1 hypothetical protein CQ052_14795 [Ochrobactrum sp. MYb15]
MAFVTEPYDFALPRGINIPNPFVFKGVLRVAGLLGAGLLAGSCLMSALGTVEAVLPAFVPLAPVMRRLPTATPHQLAVVDHKIGMGHVIRQRFIEAYTADAPYSNLDWRRNKAIADAPIIADVGPESVIEDQPVATTEVVEPREERVAQLAPTQDVVSPTVIASASIAAQTAVQDYSARLHDTLPSGDAVPVPMAAPDTQIARAPIENDTDSFLPDEVPFPGQKPIIDKPTIAKPEKQEKTQLAYAPPSGQTENIQRGLFGRLFGQAARNKTAIYDISAATVYLPSGEKLEAHSGMGHMRDNPRYVDQKMRGATPPSTYKLRMRESLFHGVEAVRLLPADGRNPYNRDGLLAHTYMLRRAGDSNGCVVFKDYKRFLNAFKRGEFDKMIVVTSMSSSAKPARIASIF